MSDLSNIIDNPRTSDVEKGEKKRLIEARIRNLATQLFEAEINFAVYEAGPVEDPALRDQVAEQIAALSSAIDTHRRLLESFGDD